MMFLKNEIRSRIDITRPERNNVNPRFDLAFDMNRNETVIALAREVGIYLLPTLYGCCFSSQCTVDRTTVLVIMVQFYSRFDANTWGVARDLTAREEADHD